MPAELTRLRRLVVQGLADTAALWPAIKVAYSWVHQAAGLLANANRDSGRTVQQRMADLLAEMRREQATVGVLAPAVAHFLKVSDSYWPGLFHCYAVAGLPRTNNDLEHVFGSARYHQRRASGRVHATAATVVRGSVRVFATIATRLWPFRESMLWHPDLDRWWQLRRGLQLRQEARRQQARFRKDPTAYLARLEATFLKPSLPS
jgi:hypothetical protein